MTKTIYEMHFIKPKLINCSTEICIIIIVPEVYSLNNFYEGETLLAFSFS